MQFRDLQRVVVERGEEAFDTAGKCRVNGWYGWSCTDASLKNRAKRFFPLIRGIKEGGRVDFGWDAWFENNRPYAYGGTYDQLLISSGERNELAIGYREPYYEETWVVYGPENGFEEPVARFGNVRGLIAWLNGKGE